ncbi:MAG TPA: HU family DNA-binding protein [Acidobacteriota bacterium]|jgi:DNA-binding protein HU-beta|nr:HU family DNA-binding protein [Acidobacteriota bacterium]
MASAKTMTKSQIVAALAEKNEVSKKQAAAFLDSLQELAVGQAKKVGKFVLPGFGILVKANRKARMGRNPATGEAIRIPAKTVCKFRVAKALKDQVVPPKK